MSQNTTQALKNGAYDGTLAVLYSNEDIEFHRQRWMELTGTHLNQTGHSQPRLFSAPGRTELSGNHTDHNRGRVLAAGVQLDTIAAVSPAKDDQPMLARVISEGYPAVSVDLSRLERVPAEENTTDALLRGIAAGIVKRGGKVGGFTATTSSRVLKGSGLSSSAALEILVGSIFNELFNEGRFTPVDLAVIGQEAENVFFGKPCGLLDQCACSIGGAVAMDFRDPANPAVESVEVRFADAGYTLAVVDSGGDHSDLTPDYAAIPSEMKSVAAHLGGEVLRDIPEDVFLAAIADLRGRFGERAVLRALHFYSEDNRVVEMTRHLKNGDIEAYLDGVRRSGDSSYRFLQNVFSPRHPGQQAVSLALALSERFLAGDGAARVHGGGFAGTIQVFVSTERFEDYRKEMETVFGAGSVVPLAVRPLPAGEVRRTPSVR